MSARQLLPTLIAVFTFALLVACQREESKAPMVEPTGQLQMTLAIIKPNAVADHHIGAILAKIEQNGLRIEGLRMVQLTQTQAQKFYAAHKERPFYNDLVNFMSSGPVVAVALEGNDAVARFRDLVGATDPSKAGSGTIRKEFGKSIEENAIHGSDSPEAGEQEIAFFFDTDELFKR